MTWTKLLLMLPLGAFLLCLSGGSARGSCGDYLHTRFGPPASSGQQHSSSHQVGGDRQESKFASEISSIGYEDSAGVEHVGQVSLSDRSHTPPCSGPGCQSNQNRSPLPTAPLPVEMTIAVKAVAASDCLKTPGASQDSLQVTDFGNASAAHRCRIERPPQPIRSTVGFANSAV
ncbi:MAG: hypothetical protein ABJZ55_13690 [Fuerstiella sp.]